MPEIISKVVGVQFSDYKQSTNYAPGQFVSLVWDRKNPYDKLAVQVFVDTRVDHEDGPNLVRIGFLPKGTDAQVIALTHGILSATLEEYHPEEVTHQMFKVKLSYDELPDNVELF